MDQIRDNSEFLNNYKNIDSLRKQIKDLNGLVQVIENNPSDFTKKSIFINHLKRLEGKESSFQYQLYDTDLNYGDSSSEIMFSLYYGHDKSKEAVNQTLIDAIQHKITLCEQKIDKLSPNSPKKEENSTNSVKNWLREKLENIFNR